MKTQVLFSRSNILTVLLFVVVTISLSILVSLLQPPKYRASTKLLVVYKEQKADAFAAARNSSYITGVLGEVMYSNTFIEQVFDANPELRDELGVEPERRQQNWKRLLSVHTEDSKGIIITDVYHGDRAQALLFAQTISSVVTKTHADYHGAGDTATIRIIDQPTASERWDQPRIPFNALIGVLAGLIAGLTFVILFPQQRLLEFLFDRRSFYADQEFDLDLLTAPLSMSLPVPATPGHNSFERSPAQPTTPTANIPTPTSNPFDFGSRTDATK